MCGLARLCQSSAVCVRRILLNATLSAQLFVRPHSLPCTQPRAPMEEEPDGKYLRLWRTAYGLALVHVGTGEWQLVGEQAELTIIDGEGALRCKSGSADPETEWAANRMTKALILESPAPGADRCQFVYDTKSKQKLQRDVEFDKGLTVVAQRLQVGGRDVFLEAFVSTLPRRDRFVRWGLSRLVCHVKGDRHDGRWVAKTVPAFRKFFEDMGYDPKLLFDSRKSVVSTCYARDQRIDTTNWSAADPDWSVSCEGFVLMCCYFVTSGKVGGDDQNSIIARGSALVDAWVGEYMRDCPALTVEVTIGANEVVGHLVIQSGAVSLPLAGDPSNLCATLVRGHMCLSDFLGHLVRILRRKSQHSKARVQLASSTLHAVVDLIAHTVTYKFIVGKCTPQAPVKCPSSTGKAAPGLGGSARHSSWRCPKRRTTSPP